MLFTQTHLLQQTLLHVPRDYVATEAKNQLRTQLRSLACMHKPNTTLRVCLPLGTLASHVHRRLMDKSLSESFFMTFVTAISKSSCVTCMRRSRRANMPALL
jgi:CBS domain containing-hemolysin-like protein